MLLMHLEEPFLNLVRDVKGNNSRWPLAFLAVSLHGWTVSLYRKVVESPFMEIIRTHLDVDLGNCSR